MRFSAIFQFPLQQPLVVRAPAPAQSDEPDPANIAQPTAIPAAHDLSEDLDVRVRMLGEW